MKKTVLFLLLSLMTLSVLAAQDVVVLSNGTIFTAEVLSYDADTKLTVKMPDTVIREYPSSEVLAIRTGVDINSLITQTFSPTWDQIKFTEGSKGKGYYIPPRYTYRGQNYSMETDWGMESQVFEFFQMLEEETLDEETKGLIDELKGRMIRQNQLVTGGLLAEAAGLVLTLVPYFVMEDNVDPVYIPEWAAWVGIGGLTLNITGLGVMISQLFVDNSSYLPRIADSFNRHLF
jgi:hypothetical protein